MGDLWNTLIIQPFSWLLLTLYQLTSNYGLSLILFSLIAKLLLLFFAFKGKRGTMIQQRLAPRLKELEKQHKGDKVKYQEAVSKLYQAEGVSPTGGCLWMIIPIPVVFALFGVVREPLKNLMKLTADQIQTVFQFFSPGEEFAKAGVYVQLDLAQKVHERFPEIQALLPDATGLIDINFNFFGLNLAEMPKWPWQELNWLIIIPILSGASAYLSTWLTQKFSGQQQQMQGGMKNMMLFMPLISVYFAFIMPAAIGVYWIAQNLFGIVQEYFLTKYMKGVLDKEYAAKEALAARRKAAEEKMKEENRLRKQAQIEENRANNKNRKTYRVKNAPTKKPNTQKKPQNTNSPETPDSTEREKTGQLE